MKKYSIINLLSLWLDDHFLQRKYYKYPKFTRRPLIILAVFLAAKVHGFVLSRKDILWISGIIYEEKEATATPLHLFLKGRE